MEVRHQSIGDVEVVGGEDKLARPAVEGLEVALRTRCRLHSAEYGGTDGADVLTCSAGSIDDGTGFFWDDHLLALHLVLGEVLDVDLAVVPQPIVYGDEGLPDILDLHTQEELAAEVEAGSRPYDSAFVLCEE